MNSKYKSLFIRQSYLDGYNIYEDSLKDKIATWDYVILTASNEEQAKGYRLQIYKRLAKGVLSPSTHYAVVPDPNGKRCGSGGATLAVLRYIILKIYHI